MSNLYDTYVMVPNKEGTSLVERKFDLFDVDHADGRSLPRAWIKYQGEPHIVHLRDGHWWLERLKTKGMRPRYHKWFAEEIKAGRIK